MEHNSFNITSRANHEQSTEMTAFDGREGQTDAGNISGDEPSLSPKIDGINDLQTDLFGSTATYITQISLYVLILILATSYIIMIGTQKNSRKNKLIWPTINVCLVTILFATHQLIFSSIQLDDPTILVRSCRLQSFLIDLTGCQMMYSHSVSALNRLLSVRYFFKLVFRSKNWLLGSIAVGWIVGSVVASPYLFYDGFICPSDTRIDWLRFYSCLTAFILPLGIVAVCNVLMFWHLRQSHRRVQNLSANRTMLNPNQNKDLHLSKVMLLAFAIFMIGWIPIFFELFMDNQRYLSPSVLALFQITLPVCLLFDMILLIYSNQPIRRHIRNMCKCHQVFPCIVQP